MASSESSVRKEEKGIRVLNFIVCFFFPNSWKAEDWRLEGDMLSLGMA